MTHNFPVPAEARMETLIAVSYKAMPAADRQSLMRIEERLLYKLKTRRPEQKSNKIPWWIVLLLAGGLATAAWWVGEQWLGKLEPIPVEEQLEPSENEKMKEYNLDKPGTKSDLSEQSDEQTTQDKKSSVIYQRENF